MSVLIKGMDIPTSCEECRLFEDPWCKAKPMDEWITAYYHPPKGEKQDDCPLIEVSPHGRLIDADALVIPKTHVDMFENCRNCMLLDEEQVKEIISNAPTIIPSDQ